MSHIFTKAKLARKRRIAGAAAAFTIAAAGVATFGPVSSAYAATYGCPSGWTCVYSGPNPATSRIDAEFFSYGAHNLSNEYGTHAVYNNQTGGAGAYLCTGYNGVNCTNNGLITYDVPAGLFLDVDLSPVNSILLTPYP